MKNVLCSYFDIRRWRIRPYSNEYHVSPWLITLDLIMSTLDNSYWLIKETHWSITIDTVIFSLTFFWRVTPHVFNINKKTESLSLSNSQKLSAPLSDKLYQNDGGSKLSIDVISEAKALFALVNEFLSSTTGRELLLLNTFLRTIGRHLVTFISLGNDELLMTKYRHISMKLKTTTTPWRLSCSDKKDRNKKTTKKSQLLKWSES